MTDSSDEGVDTKSTNSAETAEVDVDSVVTKRKAISSRRHLWVTKVVPVELESSACKVTLNIFISVDKKESVSWDDKGCKRGSSNNLLTKKTSFPLFFFCMHPTPKTSKLSVN